MKRALVAAAWIGGSTVPLVAATVFLFGCCVLPFHGVIHKLMPLCEMAANVMRGDHGDHDHETTPARQKEEPVKRIATESPETFPLFAPSPRPEALTSSAPAAYRSFLTLGAMRCDQDVGLHVLVETFRI